MILHFGSVFASLRRLWNFAVWAPSQTTRCNAFVVWSAPCDVQWLPRAGQCGAKIKNNWAGVSYKDSCMWHRRGRWVFPFLKYLLGFFEACVRAPGSNLHPVWRIKRWNDIMAKMGQKLFSFKADVDVIRLTPALIEPSPNGRWRWWGGLGMDVWGGCILSHSCVSKLLLSLNHCHFQNGWCENTWFHFMNVVLALNLWVTWEDKRDILEQRCHHPHQAFLPPWL